MTGTREEWLAARLELLEAEKELTRRSDELARRRQELPWVRDRQGVSIRDRRGERLAGGPLPRALAAPRLPLHVRARLHGGVPVLLGDRGRVQRVRRPPGEPRRHAVGGVAGAAREAAGVQAADGVDVSLGVLVRQRFQRRLQTSRSPRSNSARAASSTTTGARPDVAAGRVGEARGRSPDRGHDRHRRGHVHARAAGHERVRARGRRRLPHYSAYARGLDGLWGMYQWLDRAPKGRNETGVWWRRHDEYDKR